MRVKHDFVLALVCLAMIAVNTWLMTVPLYAATCTAKCGDCDDVECEGTTCVADDGWGCSQTVGGQTTYKTCCGELEE